MKIMNGEEFLKEPYGTVYINFLSRDFFGEPRIKSEPRGGDSWWATDVLPWEENGEFDKIMSCDGVEIKTHEFCTDDAVYNHRDDALWVVFNKKEVKEMIIRLSNALQKLQGIDNEKYL